MSSKLWNKTGHVVHPAAGTAPMVFNFETVPEAGYGGFSPRLAEHLTPSQLSLLQQGPHYAGLTVDVTSHLDSISASSSSPEIFSPTSGTFVRVSSHRPSCGVRMMEIRAHQRQNRSRDRESPEVDTESRTLTRHSGASENLEEKQKTIERSKSTSPAPDRRFSDSQLKASDYTSVNTWQVADGITRSRTDMFHQQKGNKVPGLDTRGYQKLSVVAPPGAGNPGRLTNSDNKLPVAGQGIKPRVSKPQVPINRRNSGSPRKIEFACDQSGFQPKPIPELSDKISRRDDKRRKAPRSQPRPLSEELVPEHSGIHYQEQFSLHGRSRAQVSGSRSSSNIDTVICETEPCHSSQGALDISASQGAALAHSLSLEGEGDPDTAASGQPPQDEQQTVLLQDFCQDPDEPVLDIPHGTKRLSHVKKDGAKSGLLAALVRPTTRLRLPKPPGSKPGSRYPPMNVDVVRIPENATREVDQAQEPGFLVSGEGHSEVAGSGTTERVVLGMAYTSSSLSTSRSTTAGALQPSTSVNCYSTAAVPQKAERLAKTNTPQQDPELYQESGWGQDVGSMSMVSPQSPTVTVGVTLCDDRPHTIQRRDNFGDHPPPSHLVENFTDIDHLAMTRNRLPDSTHRNADNSIGLGYNIMSVNDNFPGGADQNRLSQGASWGPPPVVSELSMSQYKDRNLEDKTENPGSRRRLPSQPSQPESKLHQSNMAQIKHLSTGKEKHRMVTRTNGKKSISGEKPSESGKGQSRIINPMPRSLAPDSRERCSSSEPASSPSSSLNGSLSSVASQSKEGTPSPRTKKPGRRSPWSKPSTTPAQGRGSPVTGIASFFTRGSSKVKTKGQTPPSQQKTPGSTYTGETGGNSATICASSATPPGGNRKQSPVLKEGQQTKQCVVTARAGTAVEIDQKSAQAEKKANPEKPKKIPIPSFMQRSSSKVTSKSVGAADGKPKAKKPGQKSSLPTKPVSTDENKQTDGKLKEKQKASGQLSAADQRQPENSASNTEGVAFQQSEGGRGQIRVIPQPRKNGASPNQSVHGAFVGKTKISPPLSARETSAIATGDAEVGNIPQCHGNSLNITRGNRTDGLQQGFAVSSDNYSSATQRERDLAQKLIPSLENQNLTGAVEIECCVVSDEVHYAHSTISKDMTPGGCLNCVPCQPGQPATLYNNTATGKAIQGEHVPGRNKSLSPHLVAPVQGLPCGPGSPGEVTTTAVMTTENKEFQEAWNVHGDETRISGGACGGGRSYDNENTGYMQGPLLKGISQTIGAISKGSNHWETGGPHIDNGQGVAGGEDGHTVCSQGTAGGRGVKHKVGVGTQTEPGNPLLLNTRNLPSQGPSMNSKAPGGIRNVTNQSHASTSRSFISQLTALQRQKDRQTSKIRTRDSPHGQSVNSQKDTHKAGNDKGIAEMAKEGDSSESVQCSSTERPCSTLPLHSSAGSLAQRYDSTSGGHTQSGRDSKTALGHSWTNKTSESHNLENNTTVAAGNHMAVTGTELKQDVSNTLPVTQRPEKQPQPRLVKPYASLNRDRPMFMAKFGYGSATQNEEKTKAITGEASGNHSGLSLTIELLPPQSELCDNNPASYTPGGLPVAVDTSDGIVSPLETVGDKDHQHEPVKAIHATNQPGTKAIKGHYFDESSKATVSESKPLSEKQPNKVQVINSGSDCTVTLMPQATEACHDKGDKSVAGLPHPTHQQEQAVFAGQICSTNITGAPARPGSTSVMGNGAANTSDGDTFLGQGYNKESTADICTQNLDQYHKQRIVLESTDTGIVQRENNNTNCYCNSFPCEHQAVCSQPSPGCLSGRDKIPSPQTAPPSVTPTDSCPVTDKAASLTPISERENICVSVTTRSGECHSRKAFEDGSYQLIGEEESTENGLMLQTASGLREYPEERLDPESSDSRQDLKVTQSGQEGEEIPGELGSAEGDCLNKPDSAAASTDADSSSESDVLQFSGGERKEDSLNPSFRILSGETGGSRQALAQESESRGVGENSNLIIADNSQAVCNEANGINREIRPIQCQPSQYCIETQRLKESEEQTLKEADSTPSLTDHSSKETPQMEGEAPQREEILISGVANDCEPGRRLSADKSSTQRSVTEDVSIVTGHAVIGDKDKDTNCQDENGSDHDEKSVQQNPDDGSPESCQRESLSKASREPDIPSSGSTPSVESSRSEERFVANPSGAYRPGREQGGLCLGNSPDVLTLGDRLPGGATSYVLQSSCSTGSRQGKDFSAATPLQKESVSLQTIQDPPLVPTKQTPNIATNQAPASDRESPQIAVLAAEEKQLSSPRGTPEVISNYGLEIASSVSDSMGEFADNKNTVRVSNREPTETVSDSSGNGSQIQGAGFPRDTDGAGGESLGVQASHCIQVCTAQIECQPCIPQVHRGSKVLDLDPVNLEECHEDCEVIQEEDGTLSVVTKINSWPSVPDMRPFPAKTFPDSLQYGSLDRRCVTEFGRFKDTLPSITGSGLDQDSAAGTEYLWDSFPSSNKNSGGGSGMGTGNLRLSESGYDSWKSQDSGSSTLYGGSGTLPRDLGILSPQGWPVPGAGRRGSRTQDFSSEDLETVMDSSQDLSNGYASSPDTVMAKSIVLHTHYEQTEDAPQPQKANSPDIVPIHSVDSECPITESPLSNISSDSQPDTPTDEQIDGLCASNSISNSDFMQLGCLDKDGMGLSVNAWSSDDTLLAADESGSDTSLVCGKMAPPKAGIREAALVRLDGSRNNSSPAETTGNPDQLNYSKLRKIGRLLESGSLDTLTNDREPEQDHWLHAGREDILDTLPDPASLMEASCPDQSPNDRDCKAAATHSVQSGVKSITRLPSAGQNGRNWDKGGWEDLPGVAMRETGELAPWRRGRNYWPQTSDPGELARSRDCEEDEDSEYYHQMALKGLLIPKPANSSVTADGGGEDMAVSDLYNKSIKSLVRYGLMRRSWDVSYGKCLLQRGSWPQTSRCRHRQTAAETDTTDCFTPSPTARRRDNIPVVADFAKEKGQDKKDQTAINLERMPTDNDTPCPSTAYPTVIPGFTSPQANSLPDLRESRKQGGNRRGGKPNWSKSTRQMKCHLPEKNQFSSWSLVPAGLAMAGVTKSFPPGPLGDTANPWGVVWLDSADPVNTETRDPGNTVTRDPDSGIINPLTGRLQTAAAFQARDPAEGSQDADPEPQSMSVRQNAPSDPGRSEWESQQSMDWEKEGEGVTGRHRHRAPSLTYERHCDDTLEAFLSAATPSTGSSCSLDSLEGDEVAGKQPEETCKHPSVCPNTTCPTAIQPNLSLSDMPLYQKHGTLPGPTNRSHSSPTIQTTRPITTQAGFLTGESCLRRCQAVSRIDSVGSTDPEDTDTDIVLVQETAVSETSLHSRPVPTNVTNVTQASVSPMVISKLTPPSPPTADTQQAARAVSGTCMSSSLKEPEALKPRVKYSTPSRSKGSGDKGRSKGIRKIPAAVEASINRSRSDIKPSKMSTETATDVQSKMSTGSKQIGSCSKKADENKSMGNSGVGPVSNCAKRPSRLKLPGQVPPTTSGSHEPAPANPTARLQNTRSIQNGPRVRDSTSSVPPKATSKKNRASEIDASQPQHPEKERRQLTSRGSSVPKELPSQIKGPILGHATATSASQGQNVFKQDHKPASDVQNFGVRRNENKHKPTNKIESSNNERRLKKDSSGRSQRDLMSTSCRGVSGEVPLKEKTKRPAESKLQKEATKSRIPSFQQVRTCFILYLMTFIKSKNCFISAWQNNISLYYMSN